MVDQDILQRFLFENIFVRGEIAHLHETYQTIIHQHDYPPVLRTFLGEALIVVSLLTSLIKYNGKVTIQFKGKGKVKLLLAECNNHFHLRGLIQWDGDLTEKEFDEERKLGLLAILMEPAVAGGTRYQGIVDCNAASFSKSIENYFLRSEQLVTRLWLAVDAHRAGGLLLQIMPTKDPELNQNDWEHLIHLTNTLKAEELLTLDNATLLRRLYAEEDIRLFSPSYLTFRCTCSTARSENAIFLLGKEEADQELNTKKELIVTCEFCNKEYIFDKVDVANIFTKYKQAGLH